MKRLILPCIITRNCKSLRYGKDPRLIILLSKVTKKCVHLVNSESIASISLKLYSIGVNSKHTQWKIYIRCSGQCNLPFLSEIQCKTQYSKNSFLHKWCLYHRFKLYVIFSYKTFLPFHSTSIYHVLLWHILCVVELSHWNLLPIILCKSIIDWIDTGWPDQQWCRRKYIA